MTRSPIPIEEFAATDRDDDQAEFPADVDLAKPLAGVRGIITDGHFLKDQIEGLSDD